MDNVFNVDEWEEILYEQINDMGIPITEELIMLITEISLEYFEDTGLIAYRNLKEYDSDG